MEKDVFLGLRTVIYKVGNLTEAKEWYSKILDKPPYFDEEYYIGFDMAGYELGLLPASESGDNNANVVAYWGVEDIQASYQRLLDLGAEPLEDPENVGGDIEVATVTDPWNNALGIIYNPHFKAEN